MKYSQLVLGSKSPRRKQLIKEMGFDCEVLSIDWNESYPNSLKANEVAQYLAREKANHAKYNLKPGQLLLTCDTTVVYQNQVVNKPNSKDEAIEMISSLAGNTHEVVTGFCLTSLNEQYTDQDTAMVVMRNLDFEDIDYYVSRYEPYDKAGGYGIQEWIGKIAIKRIEGSFYTVMGLPTHLIYEKLKQLLVK